MRTNQKATINNIGSEIRKRRTSKHLSQQKLAEILGYKNRTSISNIETGKRKPSHQDIEKLTIIFDTNFSEFIHENQWHTKLESRFLSLVRDVLTDDHLFDMLRIPVSLRKFCNEVKQYDNNQIQAMLTSLSNNQKG